VEARGVERRGGGGGVRGGGKGVRGSATWGKITTADINEERKRIHQPGKKKEGEKVDREKKRGGGSGEERLS